MLPGRESSALRPCRRTLRERAPGTHWIGDCVGPRAGLDNVENRKFFTLPGLELQSLGRPTCSHSLKIIAQSRLLIPLRCILILSTHLRLGLPSGSFFLASPPISHMHSASAPFVLHALPISYFLT
jgi:hypothetical protein